MIVLRSAIRSQDQAIPCREMQINATGEGSYMRIIRLKPCPVYALFLKKLGGPEGTPAISERALYERDENRALDIRGDVGASTLILIDNDKAIGPEDFAGERPLPVP